MEERPFQFSLRTMILANVGLAALLGLLKWLHVPTFLIVALVFILVVEGLLVVFLFVFDAISAQIKSRPEEPESETEQ